jgi:hypothetical protein
MYIAMSSALALMSWHDFRLLLGGLTSNRFAWLLIGVILAVVAISALAIEAALVLNAPHRLRSRVSWPVDASESKGPASPSQANLVGSGTRA